jgi:hypothetical protein
MSDASPPREVGPPRPLQAEEAALVKKLLAGTPLGDELDRPLAEMLVTDMADGGMGSIQFCATDAKRRLYGSTVREGSFLDQDGTLVWVALNLDQFGNLFELDIWKVDFSPLLRYPDPRDFKISDHALKPISKKKREKRHA